MLINRSCLLGDASALGASGCALQLGILLLKHALSTGMCSGMGGGGCETTAHGEERPQHMEACAAGALA